MKNIEEKTFSLLASECEIAKSCIYEGFNKLLVADALYGYNYMQSFFNLSIGLERLFKLTLLLNYAHLNSKFPERRFFKESGHDIYNLLGKCVDIAEEIDDREVLEGLHFIHHPIAISIIEQLSGFSENTRYFNLNEISNSSLKAMPFKSWQYEIEDLLIKLYNLDIQLNLDSGNNIKEYEDFRQVRLEARKHSILFLIFIIRPVIRLLVLLGNKTRHKIPNTNIPYFEEFFTELLVIPKHKILRKKRW